MMNDLIRGMENKYNDGQAPFLAVKPYKVQRTWARADQINGIDVCVIVLKHLCVAQFTLRF